MINQLNSNKCEKRNEKQWEKINKGIQKLENGKKLKWKSCVTNKISK